MKIIKGIVLCGLIMMAISCDEETMSVSDNYVVEGFIVANEPINNVTVKGILPLERTSTGDQPIANALTQITGGDQVVDLSYNSTSLRYEDPEGLLDIDVGNVYRLEVNVNGRVATAETVVPNPPTGLALSGEEIVIPRLSVNPQLGNLVRTLFDEERLNLSWDAEVGQSFFVVIEQKADDLDPILPEQIPLATRNLIGDFRFISEPSEDNSFDIIGIALETYGLHVAKVFTVNQEYVDLFENLEQDSRDLNEPPTNINNALGIFTAFAVDSLEFNVRR